MPDIMTQPDLKMFPIPRQPDLADVAPAVDEEFAQHSYVEAVFTPDPQETGQPASPIREGGGPVNAVEAEKSEAWVNATDTGRNFTYPTDNTAVLNEANTGVANAYAAEEAADRAHIASQEAHARMANQTADALTHTVTTMRERALESTNRNDYELAA